MEIEKKYLVKEIPFDLENFQKCEMVQGYIHTDPVIRVRSEDGEGVLTIKGKGEIARKEFELPLTKEQFDGLWKKIDPRCIPVCKTRYFIPLGGGLTAELDIYHAELEGLLTVEVEFESMERAEGFTPPDWFGEEVSLDSRYKNSALAFKGKPDFSRESR